jgi:hypothetical protein
MKKVIFLADMFASDHTGGAELHDDVVISYFRKKGILHDLLRCGEITRDYIDKNLDKVWFISNFASLDPVYMAYLMENTNYFIYEHDYKFVDVRNPISFRDFQIPAERIINVNFYRNAKKIICLSRLHREIFYKNLKLDNIDNINCSMWHDTDLEIFEKFQNKNKKNKFAIIESSNPIKKTQESIDFCEKNKIEFDLISSKNYLNFIEKLSDYSGLVFMTGHPEPTPRVAIEAKMLNMKFISQKHLIGVAHEDYFHLTGQEMINEVRKMRDEALVKIGGWIEQD